MISYMYCGHKRSNQVHHMNLEPHTHLPTDMEVLLTKRNHCIVCRIEKNIGKTHGNMFHIKLMSKRFKWACVFCGLHVHSRVHLNSKCQKFPNLRGKLCFEILHLETCDGSISTND